MGISVFFFTTAQKSALVLELGYPGLEEEKMLRTDLIELINRCDMWAFVGSGVSVDSGYPTWGSLIETVLDKLESALRDRIVNDPAYQAAFAKGNYAQCFSRIEKTAGREALERPVIQETLRTREPGHIVQRLVDWPFAGYITTNYDGLLESTLQKSGHHGWSPVGNSSEEVRKVSGAASEVVWHVHGAACLSSDKSRLILTEEDYDRLYLSDDSPAVAQLRGLLAQRRVVFIGFGFQDSEVLRLLKKVGRLSNPARTAYAFLSGLSGPQHESERKELLQKYNVDTIPYEVVDCSHEQLLALMDVYGAMILRRSLRFGQSARPCPSYHPETTGLLVYNELCLKGGSEVSKDVLGTLLKARVLALLKHEGQSTLGKLVDDLNERAKTVGGRMTSAHNVEGQIEAVIQDLLKSGLVSLAHGQGANRHLALTPKGSSTVSDHAAAAERLAEQFMSSLQSRAKELLPSDHEAALRVGKAAESFLKDCATRRALGVAMTIHAGSPEYQQYHMVALLQSLPQFMPQLFQHQEAVALVSLVSNVLAKPTEAEAKYIGLCVQAQFGVHLLGYDPDTLQARAPIMERALFLADSSTLIPFLARSSIGHKASRLLIERLRAMNAVVATTMWLAVEVAEHARWATQKVDPNDGQLRVEALRAAMGSAGEKSNAFLDGFIEEASRGEVVPDFREYLSQIFGCRKGENRCTDDDIQRSLKNAGIECRSFHEWEGFLQDLWSQRDDVQTKIANLREQRKTFKHERQTKAEAEALIIIQSLRDGKFSVPEHAVSDAYFISHTRVIDNVAGAGFPITMRPEAALQWVATLNPCTIDELRFITNGLLWELSERGLSVVDKPRLQRAFAPILDASREKLEEVTSRHKVLLSQTYGENAADAFNEAALLDKPLVLDSYSIQRAEELERKLAEEEKRRVEAEGKARLSEKDRDDLNQLRMQDRHRKQKARAKKRRIADYRRKKKKGKGKRR